ncbi:MULTISPECIES: cupin domain-containing protein [Arthrobacter]|uniref:Cupin domain-containing protein n=2 Tax=Arthrobacter TaxID=1663 RepID=A0ABU9KIV6_9MICC|nr:cupin domain-containing protein [Arthrobacter sp. YJM1]MDP5227040.1 cupin domain-containing protein [Arthrobacter sp. YJM1]
MADASRTATLHHVPDASLEHEPLPTEQVLAGSPTAGILELEDLAGCGVGVWEMTPGTATDVEAEEVFVVLSGSARVDFLDAQDTVEQSLELTAGDLVRLRAGQRTVWAVRETLRKVYLSA